jgi:hypothetical protein
VLFRETRSPTNIAPRLLGPSNLSPLREPEDGRSSEVCLLRGWVNYFAVGHSSECFSFIKDWVEKKVRRHLVHAQKRKGFGWERWNRRCVQRLSSATRRAESRPSRIGPIGFGVKQMGARSAGNPHAACDVEGTGDVVWVGTPGHNDAPALDPTCGNVQRR